MDDLKKLTSSYGTFKTVENAPVRKSLSVVGSAVKTTPQARFARAMPEVAAKSLYCASVASLYAFVKAVAPTLVGLAKDGERAVLSPMLATLPSAVDGACASAVWREGDEHGFMLRVSADEIRGLAALGNAVFAYAMMRPRQDPPAPDWAEELDDGDNDD